jgi:hypothetical protein
MIFLASFFVELFLLFLLSKQLTILVSHFFFRITHSTKTMIYLMAVLFFPGTVIHELSHFLMAQLLFVRTGEIDLFPEAQEGGVKLGSVAIARSDPFRRLFIGMAPFLFGTAILLMLLFFAIRDNWFANPLLLTLTLYALFEIGNTMFSSRKDMEGALELLIVLIFLGIVFYFLGIRLPAVNPDVLFGTPILVKLFQTGSALLLVPIGLDIVIIGLLKLIKK